MPTEVVKKWKYIYQVALVMCFDSVHTLDPKLLVDLAVPLRWLGEGCGYESCPVVAANVLNVHLVPHTHFELGYWANFDEHFYGTRMNPVHRTKTKISMPKVLDAVLTELWNDKTRRFTLAEIPYFFKWWKQRDATVHRMVYELVRQNRLSFVGGGWGQSDEATTNYQALIDLHTFGLGKLNSTFLDCGRPLVAWQPDSYGHSKEFASLMALMGYDGLFIAPISYDEEIYRMFDKALEFVWRGNDDLGLESDIFTHKLFDGFWHPPGFCFSRLCDDPLIVSSGRLFTNIEERISEFAKSMLYRQSPNYRTQNVLVVMGNRLGYSDAELWFKNIDKLILGVNARTGENGTAIKAFYSTPACYLKAVNEAKPTLPVEQNDFMPYRFNKNSYATGMYTTKASLKLQIAEANIYFQISKQLHVLARLGGLDRVLEEFKWIMGVSQDHSIIPGLLYTNATAYYEQKIYAAVQMATGTMKRAFDHFRGSDPTTEYYRCSFNESICINFNNTRATVTVYNPLGWPVTIPVRLPVERGTNLAIYDHNGEQVTASTMKIPEPILALNRHHYFNYTHEVVFIAKDIPPLGFKAYFSDPISSRIIRTKKSVTKYLRRKSFEDHKLLFDKDPINIKRYDRKQRKIFLDNTIQETFTKKPSITLQESFSDKLKMKIHQKMNETRMDLQTRRMPEVFFDTNIDEAFDKRLRNEIEFNQMNYDDMYSVNNPVAKDEDETKSKDFMNYVDVIVNMLPTKKYDNKSETSTESVMNITEEKRQRISTTTENEVVVLIEIANSTDNIENTIITETLAYPHNAQQNKKLVDNVPKQTNEENDIYFRATKTSTYASVHTNKSKKVMDNIKTQQQDTVESDTYAPKHNNSAEKDNIIEITEDVKLEVENSGSKTLCSANFTNVTITKLMSNQSDDINATNNATSFPEQHKYGENDMQMNEKTKVSSREREFTVTTAEKNIIVLNQTERDNELTFILTTENIIRPNLTASEKGSFFFSEPKESTTTPKHISKPPSSENILNEIAISFENMMTPKRTTTEHVLLPLENIYSAPKIFTSNRAMNDSILEHITTENNVTVIKANDNITIDIPAHDRTLTTTVESEFSVQLTTEIIKEVLTLKIAEANEEKQVDNIENSPPEQTIITSVDDTLKPSLSGNNSKDTINDQITHVTDSGTVNKSVNNVSPRRTTTESVFDVLIKTTENNTDVENIDSGRKIFSLNSTINDKILEETTTENNLNVITTNDNITINNLAHDRNNINQQLTTIVESEIGVKPTTQMIKKLQTTNLADANEVEQIDFDIMENTHTPESYTLASSISGHNSDTINDQITHDTNNESVSVNNVSPRRTTTEREFDVLIKTTEKNYFEKSTAHNVQELLETKHFKSNESDDTPEQTIITSVGDTSMTHELITENNNTEQPAIETVTENNDTLQRTTTEEILLPILGNITHVPETITTFYQNTDNIDIFKQRTTEEETNDVTTEYNTNTVTDYNNVMETTTKMDSFVVQKLKIANANEVKQVDFYDMENTDTPEHTGIISVDDTLESSLSSNNSKDTINDQITHVPDSGTVSVNNVSPRRTTTERVFDILIKTTENNTDVENIDSARKIFTLNSAINDKILEETTTENNLNVITTNDNITINNLVQELLETKHFKSNESGDTPEQTIITSVDDTSMTHELITENNNTEQPAIETVTENNDTLQRTTTEEKLLPILGNITHVPETITTFYQNTDNIDIFKQRTTEEEINDVTTEYNTNTVTDYNNVMETTAKMDSFVVQKLKIANANEVKQVDFYNMENTDTPEHTVIISVDDTLESSLSSNNSKDKINDQITHVPDSGTVSVNNVFPRRTTTERVFDVLIKTTENNTDVENIDTARKIFTLNSAINDKILEESTTENNLNVITTNDNITINNLAQELLETKHFKSNESDDTPEQTIITSVDDTSMTHELITENNNTEQPAIETVTENNDTLQQTTTEEILLPILGNITHVPETITTFFQNTDNIDIFKQRTTEEEINDVTTEYNTNTVTDYNNVMETTTKMDSFVVQKLKIANANEVKQVDFYNMENTDTPEHTVIISVDDTLDSSLSSNNSKDTINDQITHVPDSGTVSVNNVSPRRTTTERVFDVLIKTTENNTDVENIDSARKIFTLNSAINDKILEDTTTENNLNVITTNDNITINNLAQELLETKHFKSNESDDTPEQTIITSVDDTSMTHELITENNNTEQPAIETVTENNDTLQQTTTEEILLPILGNVAHVPETTTTFYQVTDSIDIFKPTTEMIKKVEVEQIDFDNMENTHTPEPYTLESSLSGNNSKDTINDQITHVPDKGTVTVNIFSSRRSTTERVFDVLMKTTENVFFEKSTAAKLQELEHFTSNDSDDTTEQTIITSVEDTENNATLQRTNNTDKHGVGDEIIEITELETTRSTDIPEKTIMTSIKTNDFQIQTSTENIIPQILGSSTSVPEIRFSNVSGDIDNSNETKTFVTKENYINEVTDINIKVRPSKSKFNDFSIFTPKRTSTENAILKTPGYSTYTTETTSLYTEDATNMKIWEEMTTENELEFIATSVNDLNNDINSTDTISTTKKHELDFFSTNENYTNTVTEYNIPMRTKSDPDVLLTTTENNTYISDQRLSDRNKIFEQPEFGTKGSIDTAKFKVKLAETIDGPEEMIITSDKSIQFTDMDVAKQTTENIYVNRSDNIYVTETYMNKTYVPMRTTNKNDFISTSTEDSTIKRVGTEETPKRREFKKNIEFQAAKNKNKPKDPNEIPFLSADFVDIEPAKVNKEKEINIKEYLAAKKEMEIRRQQDLARNSQDALRRKVMEYSYDESLDDFIENQHIKIFVDRATHRITSLNTGGDAIFLDIQFYFYEPDIPDTKVVDQTLPSDGPGPHIFRALNNEPIAIQDSVRTDVYKNVLVQEIHMVFSNYTSFALRLYEDSVTVELDWLVGPVPSDGLVGKEVFIRYKTNLASSRTFYTDANGRQMMKRIRNAATTVDGFDDVAGNIYPVTSRISIEDTHRNLRLSVFNDRSQGGTSLHDGEIDLMLHRRVLYSNQPPIDELDSNDVPILVRGKHYIHLGKANHKPSEIYDKRLAKEVNLMPKVSAGRFKWSLRNWLALKNTYKGLRKLPIGVHLLTLEKWNFDTLLIRLENYLETSDVMKHKTKTVYVRDLITGIRIKSMKETTLAANQWMEDLNPLHWKKEAKFYKNFNKEFGGTGRGVYDDVDELRPLQNDFMDNGVKLEPQQIRTFVAQFEYV